MGARLGSAPVPAALSKTAKVISAPGLAHVVTDRPQVPTHRHSWAPRLQITTILTDMGILPDRAQLVGTHTNTPQIATNGRTHILQTATNARTHYK